ncbi:aminopeptidase N-like, partial [Penaeus japonicus]|uniref:aminopeptidase N-like n=1 Tax=Penaeus japonicus TaxID=27405 RepID=UPI001C711355
IYVSISLSLSLLFTISLFLFKTGASVIRMMYFFLTEATFKKGLTNYLTNFEYDAAAQDDLWEFLTAAAHEDKTLPDEVSVKDIMDTWTLLTGYPVVKLERDEAGTSATVTQAYLLNLVTSLYDEVGFEDDLNGLHLDQYKRALALSWACHLGLPQCVDESVQQFEEMLNGTDVSANLKSTVYCTAMAEGGEAEWDAAWNLYLESNVGAEKDRLLSALGCTKEIWLLSRYLNMAFTEGSGIRRQDARTVFRAVANNDIGRYLAWDYLKNHWEDISTYLGAFTTLGNLVSYVTAEFNTQEELQQLEAFYEANMDNLATAARAFKQAMESTTNNIAWMENNYEAIVTWLDEAA